MQELETLVADGLGASFPGDWAINPSTPARICPGCRRQRYRIMRDYMPKCGSLGLDMMQSTCALQVTADLC